MRSENTLFHVCDRYVQTLFNTNFLINCFDRLKASTHEPLVYGFLMLSIPTQLCKIRRNNRTR